MNFTSPLFLLAFPLTAGLYPRIPKKHRWLLLLAVSQWFYGWANWRLLPLLWLVTLSTWLAARLLHRGRFWLGMGVAVPLTCLGVFKYGDFLTGTRLGLVLPVGISFYTFQSLGYLLDVRRGRVAPEKNLFRYALFVSFFPQLVAGPIERTESLLPQLNEGRLPTAEERREGLWRLLSGYTKKLTADWLAPFVDSVYSVPAMAGGLSVLLATAAFAFQIYLDFSAYSDIAIGAARLLGVRLCENFDRPYTAASPRAFWRRWHKSLTRWFTDYLYIPLGGSRCGLPRQLFNLLVVFLCSGLWHGAAWHFVAWGLFHGLLLWGQLLWERSGLPTPSRPVGQGLTFGLCLFGWVFFRADSVGAALTLLSRLGSGWTVLPTALLTLLGWALGVWFCGLLPRKSPDTAQGWLAPLLPLLTAVLFQLTGTGGSAFLYFQF